jgi:hypothetical protein
MTTAPMNLRAMVAPYSSVVGQSVVLVDADGRVVAQLAVMTPAGPPPGMSARAYQEQVAADVAAKINAGKPA